ncbi:hypothetical protein QVD17_38969 [Tagetes erecta]|uniref:Uncharacterized protein n=1 Tax=Tagetes erecta TaxID=13708 RepID=A0AAD8N9U0_TARER|nr:hypothetical protein QVD17_38969 [Tagetes erecta]
MATTDTQSPNQHDNDHDPITLDPNPNHSLEAVQSPQQHSETLEQEADQSETLDSPNANQSPEKYDDAVLILENDDHQAGNVRITLPEPILLTDNPSPPPVVSPTSRVNKRKTKGGGRKMYKRKRPTKKVQNLTDSINPIPFVVTKTLDIDKHEEVLKRLGLYDFSKIEFDCRFRTDLIVELIVNYDAKKRCSYVNGLRVNVNRADLARALKLPAPKQDKGNSGLEEVDLDSELFSDEDIGFIEGFVFSWLVLCEESSAEIVNWTRCIRDGHPEKLDPASLIWYMVEKELTQGDKLVDCYYAPHLQYLIRLQRPSFFNEDDILKASEEKEERDEIEEKEEKDEREEQEENEEKYEKEEKEQEENEEKDEKEVSMVQEQSIELTLGTDAEEIAHQEVKKDDEMMVDCNEEMEAEHGNFKNILGDHFLQRCQSSDLNNFEEIRVEEEQIEQVEEEEEEDEGFDIEANDDSFDRDGMTDNFLQGVETSHNPYNSHGMDLFGSRDGSFSFYNNGGKRVMEAEEDIGQNSKRLKTNELWDEKQNDIGFCFEQMQQLMQKAKMIHESKERNYENLQYNQQVTMDQFQERQQILEMIIKSKDQELDKKHAEVFRLERELFLMGDLLAGYRKALNDTRAKFSDYRKRFALQEEPLYKDAGPGGLVLSTREIEKQRLKQEEDMFKFQIVAKNIEEEFVHQLELQNGRLLPMVDKLVSIENQVQRLKEIAKETQQPSAGMEPSVELQETQKSEDDATMESVPPKSEDDAGMEPSVKPQENQKSDDDAIMESVPSESEDVVGIELSVEPLENQKSEDNAIMDSVPPESEDDAGIEPSVEPQENQKAEDDATTESVPPESEEKGGK